MKYKAEYQQTGKYVETIQVVVEADSSEEALLRFEDDDLLSYLTLRRELNFDDEVEPIFVPVIDSDD